MPVESALTPRSEGMQASDWIAFHDQAVREYRACPVRETGKPLRTKSFARKGGRIATCVCSSASIPYCAQGVCRKAANVTGCPWRAFAYAASALATVLSNSG